jgi:hypothetical protein
MTAQYEVRVQGQLPADWADWFDGLTLLATEQDETVMQGIFDQAALHGLLRKLGDLNLPLIAIQRQNCAPRDQDPVSRSQNGGPHASQ